ncbi:uncharacterized protein WCI35_032080, partial [Daubentonia madagascariensis]
RPGHWEEKLRACLVCFPTSPGPAQRLKSVLQQT